MTKARTVANGSTPLVQKVETFTSTGTFTAPSNVSAVEIFLVAGGGGGGGNGSTGSNTINNYPSGTSGGSGYCSVVYWS